MTENTNVVLTVLNAAGGEIIGRVRLQKILFLLQEKELVAQSNFSYHHYGPYSADLANQTSISKAFGKLDENWEANESGRRYSIFRLTDTVKEDANFAQDDNLTNFVMEIKSEDSTILELASTIRWLIVHEKIENWEEELFKRKGKKTENGRMKNAQQLLERIGLH